MSQIRNIIIEREKRRGKPYFEAEPAASQSTAMLAHTFETCLQELDHVISVKDCRVLEVSGSLFDSTVLFSCHLKVIYDYVISVIFKDVSLSVFVCS